MKYVSKISVVLFAMVAMAACSKKGKGGAPAPAPGVGAVGVQCVTGQAGCTPYYGPGGQWSGALTVVNPGVYQQMILQNGSGGFMGSQYVGVSIRLSQGSGRFKISTAMGAQWIPVMQKNGQAYSQGINNFSIVTQNYYITGMPYQQTMIYPGQPIAPGAQNMISVSVQFVDAIQMVGNAQISFNGVIVAQGQVSGRPFLGGGYNGGYQYQTSNYAPPVLPANSRYY